MDRLLAEPSWGMLNFVRRSFVYEVAMILGMSPSVADFVALTQYRPEWFEESRWFGFVLGRDDTAQSGFSMFVVAKDMYPMAIGLSKLVASVGSVSPQGLPVSDYRIGVAKYAKGAACYGLQQWKDANSVEEQQPDVKEEPASALVAGETMPMSIAKRVCAEDPEQVVGLVGYCYLLAVRPERRLEVLGALGASPTYAELSSVDPACLQPAAEFERLGAVEVPGGWHWFRTTSSRVVPVSQVCGKKDSVPEWVWKELVQSRHHCDVRRMWTAELSWHELSGLPVSYFVSPLRAWSFGFVWHYDRGWCFLRSSRGLSVSWAGRAEAEQRVGKDEFLSRFLAYIGLPEEHTEGVYEAGLELATRGRPVAEAEALGRYGLFRAGAALEVLSATAGAAVVPMALSKASLADMALQFDTGGIDASQFMGGLFAVVARLGGQPLLMRFLRKLGACGSLEEFERPLCIASFSNSALVLCKKSLEVTAPGHDMEHVGLGTACVTSDWKQLEVPEGLSVLVATEDDVRRVRRMMPTVVDKAVNVSTVRATRGRTFRHVWLVRFGTNWDCDTWNNEDWARVATSRHTSSFTYVRCDGVTDYVERWASSDWDSVFPL